MRADATGPAEGLGVWNVPLDFGTVKVMLWQPDSQNVKDGGSFQNAELRETEIQSICKDTRRGSMLFVGGPSYHLSSPNNSCVDSARDLYSLGKSLPLPGTL